MHPTLPRLEPSDFPALVRGALDTLQVNLGYLCNQQCLHCHVAAGPHRTEVMTRETIDQVIGFLDASAVSTLDLTGGAPEMNPHFKDLVRAARERGIRVIDRCNLTVLLLPGYEALAGFLAALSVEITASLPCYLEDNVDAQRGNGVHASSIEALRRLNALGYGIPGSGRVLNLVYNPLGPTLPPAQAPLEAAYKDELAARYGIVFNQLFALANMPIQRFGSTLISKGSFDGYLELLRSAHRPENIEGVMCRSLVSVDWQGYVYDCDFNQMLGLGLGSLGGVSSPVHLSQLIGLDLEGAPIAVRNHCYGCTAGQGSSCGGSLAASGERAGEGSTTGAFATASVGA
ncbi:MAG: arsenosugar biosynthesis radical SAM protein ArsS [Proteobacteria bacterium]|nr:arsenosugar biosynthesis radical SAM protein ArsS [Burkholderiales bacterium]